jgi:hypothetical protein
VTDLEKRREEDFARNSPGRRFALVERIAMRNDRVVDLKSGNRWPSCERPQQGFESTSMNSVMGTIKGDDLATVFLSMWLGENPPIREWMSGLQGGAGD